jgi:hypothetical protein
MVFMTEIRYPMEMIEQLAKRRVSNTAAILCLLTGRFGCKTEVADEEKPLSLP